MNFKRHDYLGGACFKPGHKITPVASSSISEDAQDCQAKCTQSQTCGFFTFYKTIHTHLNNCELSGRNSTIEITKLDTIVGPRDCVGPVTRIVTKTGEKDSANSKNSISIKVCDKAQVCCSVDNLYKPGERVRAVGQRDVFKAALLHDCSRVGTLSILRLTVF